MPGRTSNAAIPTMRRATATRLCTNTTRRCKRAATTTTPNQLRRNLSKLPLIPRGLKQRKLHQDNRFVGAWQIRRNGSDTALDVLNDGASKAPSLQTRWNSAG